MTQKSCPELIKRKSYNLIQKANLEAFMSKTGSKGYSYLKDNTDKVALLFVDISLEDSINGIALAITTATDHPHIRICVTSARTKLRPTELPITVKYLTKP